MNVLSCLVLSSGDSIQTKGKGREGKGKAGHKKSLFITLPTIMGEWIHGSHYIDLNIGRVVAGGTVTVGRKEKKGLTGKGGEG